MGASPKFTRWVGNQTVNQVRQPWAKFGMKPNVNGALALKTCWRLGQCFVFLPIPQWVDWQIGARRFFGRFLEGWWRWWFVPDATDSFRIFWVKNGICISICVGKGRYLFILNSLHGALSFGYVFLLRFLAYLNFWWNRGLGLRDVYPTEKRMNCWNPKESMMRKSWTWCSMVLFRGRIYSTMNKHHMHTV